MFIVDIGKPAWEARISVSILDFMPKHVADVRSRGL